jgi:hypothetical protein
MNECGFYYKQNCLGKISDSRKAGAGEIFLIGYVKSRVDDGFFELIRIGAGGIKLNDGLRGIKCNFQLSDSRQILENVFDAVDTAHTGHAFDFDNNGLHDDDSLK